jgi:hypothetical protein
VTLPTVDAPVRYYTTEKLTGNLELTPDGFLLCRNVPVARTGSMLYGPGETDVEVGPGGYALIDCEPQDLFHADTISSSNGKPVLDEHPTNQDHGVGSDNWSQLARGVMLNPHRGSAEEGNNLLMADLMIQDQSLIEDILGIDPGSLHALVESGKIKDAINNRKGKREVSLGYEADYEQLEPGKGRKVNIIVNHVALVKAGRCGSGCKITDHLTERTRKMSKETLISRLRKAFKTKDEEGFNQMLEGEVEPMTGDEGGGEAGGVHVHVHAPTGPAPAVISGDKKTKDAEEETARLEAERKAKEEGGRSKFTDAELENRFKTIGDALEEIKGLVAPKTAPNAMEKEGDGEEGYMKPKEGTSYDSKEIEGELEEEAPEGTGDAAKKSTDSAFLVESFRDTVAMAEILAPGVKIPTFDRAWHPRVTVDNICRLRKAALVKGLGDADTKELIVSARGGRTTDAATVRKLTCDSTRMLFNTAAAAKKTANNASITAGRKTTDAATVIKMPASPADMNKKNADFWKNRS